MRPSYRIVSYRIEKKTLISYRYRIESKKSLSLLSVPGTSEQAQKDIREVVAAAARALHPVSTSREGAIPKTVKTVIAKQKKGGKRGAGEPSEATHQP